jgi:hypothetical protein
MTLAQHFHLQGVLSQVYRPQRRTICTRIDICSMWPLLVNYHPNSDFLTFLPFSDSSLMFVARGPPKPPSWLDSVVSLFTREVRPASAEAQWVGGLRNCGMFWWSAIHPLCLCQLATKNGNTFVCHREYLFRCRAVSGPGGLTSCSRMGCGL